MPEKTEDCKFCKHVASPNEEDFYFSESGLFFAKWDFQPDTPGHALVIPKRHVLVFAELNQAELAELGRVVEEVKEIISRTDLLRMYHKVYKDFPNELSRQRIAKVIGQLEEIGNTPPDAFNDAINDGLAAGQTIHHLHWHIKPRWFAENDELDE